MELVAHYSRQELETFVDEVTASARSIASAVLRSGCRSTRATAADARKRVEGWPPVTKLGGHPVWIGTALEGSGVLYPLEDTSSDRYYLYYLGR